MSYKTKRKLLDHLTFVMFTFPAFFCVLMVTNIPFLLNLYYSFFDWDGISRSKQFIGFDNFVRIFTMDKSFFKSLLFTLRFTFFYVLIVNSIAILIAYVLSKNSKIGYVIRSFYFVPHIISLVAISLIWKSIFGTGFTTLYEQTNISFFGNSFLGDPNIAFYSIVFVTVWQNVGFYMIIYIAGFMGIPPSLIEAASIDGAGSVVRFFKIQLPLLMPAITISIFTSLTYAFKLFDIILVLTKGGPAGATTSISFNIYEEAFVASRYGIATTKSLIFFVLVMVITMVQLYYFKRKEVEL